MFENLSSRLDKAFQTLKGHSTLTELNIAEISLQESIAGYFRDLS